MDLARILKNETINGWQLFWLIAGPTSLIMVVAMLRIDGWDGPAVSSLIQLSVRLAVPWLFLAFAASSVLALFPGPASLWLARNRRYIGLSFAAGMAWQGLFILWLVTVYSDYYLDEVYVLRDAIEGVFGYAFLTAMTITSFMPVRKRMSRQAWKLLHKSGIYFLWAYALSTYWWALFYYPEPALLDYVFHWTGFAAGSLRLAAWIKKRNKTVRITDPQAENRPALRALGFGLIGAAVVAAAFSRSWLPDAENLLYGYSFTRLPELYLPYWPFEPFLPLMIIGVGGYLITKART